MIKFRIFEKYRLWTSTLHENKNCLWNLVTNIVIKKKKEKLAANKTKDKKFGYDERHWSCQRSGEETNPVQRWSTPQADNLSRQRDRWKNHSAVEGEKFDIKQKKRIFNVIASSIAYIHPVYGRIWTNGLMIMSPIP